jgi:phosphatidylethanolamine-binding protein (PEBP) family uncharacterized protein
VFAAVAHRMTANIKPRFSPGQLAPSFGNVRASAAPGDGPHCYVFRLLAVDEPVALKGLPSYRDVEAAVTGHALGEARLIGTYQR